MGARPLSPISTRHLPHSPGERPLFTPGPAHTDTPTPRLYIKVKDFIEKGVR